MLLKAPTIILLTVVTTLGLGGDTSITNNNLYLITLG